MRKRKKLLTLRNIEKGKNIFRCRTVVTYSITILYNIDEDVLLFSVFFFSFFIDRQKSFLFTSMKQHIS